MTHTREEAAIILNSLGYQVDRTWKFRLRADDKTPSASIHPKTGKIKDFGSGWYGSIIDLMAEFHNYTKADAFKRAEEILGRDDARLTLLPIQTSPTLHKKQKIITQNFIDKFLQERRDNFDRFWQLLCQTLPAATSEERKNIANKFEIGYTKMGDRLIMPIRDEFGDCQTLWKYNPCPTPFLSQDGKMITPPKYKFTGDRQRCHFNIGALLEYIKTPKEPILLMEGEKDCLNALSKGFRAISVGSSSTPIANKYLELFKNTNVTICYDNDEAGRKGALAINDQLKDICKRVEILDWQDIAKRLNLKKPLKQGFDFTDFVIMTEKKTKLIQKDKSMSK